METTEQKVSRLEAMIEAVRRIALRHADRHGGGGPDPTKITTSAHTRLHSISDPLDHSGSITSTQHGTIATGDLHTEYVKEALFDAHTIIAATADNTPAAVTVAEQRVVGRVTGGNIDDLTIGIADDNMVQVDGSPADDEYARFTANGLEGRTEAEFKGDFNLEDADITTLAKTVKIDDLAAGDDNTDLDVSTTKHGLAPKAVAPAAGLINFYGIANAETAITNKALFDATVPTTIAESAAAAAGTAAVSARRDHTHGAPATYAPTAHKDSHDPNDGSDPLDTAAPANIDGVQAAAVGTAHTLARADHAHRIQHAIADNALVTVDQADAADNDFAKFTASGLEGRSYQETKADLGLPLYREVTITIPTPAANDDFTIRTFDEAVTLFEVASVIVAGTNVVFNLYHGNDHSAAGTKKIGRAHV